MLIFLIILIDSEILQKEIIKCKNIANKNKSAREKEIRRYSLYRRNIYIKGKLTGKQKCTKKLFVAKFIDDRPIVEQHQ